MVETTIIQRCSKPFRWDGHFGHALQISNNQCSSAVFDVVAKALEEYIIIIMGKRDDDEDEGATKSLDNN